MHRFATNYIYPHLRPNLSLKQNIPWPRPTLENTTGRQSHASGDRGGQIRQSRA